MLLKKYCTTLLALVGHLFVVSSAADVNKYEDSTTSNNVDINERFHVHLLGQVKVNHNIVLSMWDHYYNGLGKTSPHAKSKHPLEERMKNFKNSVHRVIAHNTKRPRPSWTAGLHEYSDMSLSEIYEYFQIQPLGKYGAEQHCAATTQMKQKSGDTTKGTMQKPEDGLDGSASKKQELPDNFDWREHNGVSPVKNQGSCGSCWTFSTVACLESHSLIKYGKTEIYAEQQLVDCAQAYDNHGCNGGLPSHAFEYLEGAGGIVTNASYPYFAKEHACSIPAHHFALGVKGGSVNITRGDEVELKDAIFKHGPVSIAFQVFGNFMDYKSGVYSSDACKSGEQDVNHAVLAVGYGVSESTATAQHMKKLRGTETHGHQESGATTPTDYWIVKNSWGPKWGDQGFFKIQRGTNMCGVAMCNSFPADVVKLDSGDTAETEGMSQTQLMHEKHNDDMEVVFE